MKSSIRRWAVSTLATSALLAGCGADSPDDQLKSAQQMLTRNETATAVIQLKNVLQKRPDSPQARFLLGKALLASGDAKAAVVELRKSLAVQQSPNDVVPVLARAMLEEGAYRALIDEFAAVSLSQPAAAADLRVSIGSAYADLADLANARQAAADALRLSPNDVSALLLRARLAGQERRFKDALEIVTKAIGQAPDDPRGWVYQGDARLLGSDDVAGAVQAYRKALSIAPNHVPARANLIALLLRQRDMNSAESELALLRKAKPNHPQTVYLDAQLALAKGDLKTADELVQQLLKVVPENLRALILAGTVAGNAGSLQVAERSFSKALSLSSDQPDIRRQLARTYVRMGQPDKALATITPLVGASSTDAQAHAIAADARMLTGDFARANAHFAAAVRLDPKDMRSKTALTLTRLNTVSADDAISELQSISAADKGTFADLALINALVAKKDYPRALTALDAVDAKQPGRAGMADMRGRVLLLQGKTAEARSAFERAVELDRAYIPSIAQLAQLDMNDGKRDAARKRFDSVLAVDPKNLQALVAIASIKALEGASSATVAELLANAAKLNPQSPAPRLLLINLYLGQKDTNSARKAAQEAYAALPDNLEVIDTLGVAQAASGETHQAIATFQKLAALEPRSIRPQMRMAGVHLKAKDLGAAQQSFRRALDIAPDSVLAQEGLIEAMLADNRARDALAFAKSLQKRYPDKLPSYLFEGRIHASQNAFDAAAETYRMALKRFPVTDAAAKLHATLLAGAKVQEAEKVASAWLAQHPKDLSFIAYAGDSAMARKDYRSAEDYFRQVAELQPANARALNNIAWLMLKQQKTGAAAYAERADKLRPDSPELMDTLATALAAEGNIDRAMKVQKRAIELSPSNATLRLTLAKLYLQSGMATDARSELETLARLGSRFEQQAEVAQLLQKR